MCSELLRFCTEVFKLLIKPLPEHHFSFLLFNLISLRHSSSGILAINVLKLVANFCVELNV